MHPDPEQLSWHSKNCILKCIARCNHQHNWCCSFPRRNLNNHHMNRSIRHYRLSYSFLCSYRHRLLCMYLYIFQRSCQCRNLRRCPCKCRYMFLRKYLHMLACTFQCMSRCTIQSMLSCSHQRNHLRKSQRKSLNNHPCSYRYIQNTRNSNQLCKDRSMLLRIRLMRMSPRPN